MIHLICALPCEGKPLIDCHGLRHVPRADLFKIYVRRDGGMSLTLSGPGKTNAAAAVIYTHTLFSSRAADAWLNIGVAGHRSLDPGTAVLAHRIEDAGSGHAWYPQFSFPLPCPTLNLRTLDRPSTDYHEEIIDMEAAGFFNQARRCGTAELIQVLKVISDNAAQPAGKPDARYVTGLIKNGLMCINNVIDSLQSLSCGLAATQQPPPLFNDCLDRWHFTEYERNALLRLLHRWDILCPGRPPPVHSMQFRKGGDLIEYLGKELSHMTLSFGE
jgi:hypothetical protein